MAPAIAKNTQVVRMMIFFEVYIAAKSIIGHNCLSKSGQNTRTP
jgi:hypothetical protein